MHTEFEATFFPIDIQTIKETLIGVGATCIKPMFLQTRTTMKLPDGQDNPGSLVRIRDEGDRITLAWKQFTQDGSIESQSEIEVEVSSYDAAVSLMQKIGCTSKAVQESKREIRELDGVQIMLDERPFLEPFLEIEGSGEAQVKKIAQDLGCDRNDALFDSVTPLYAEKYGVSQAFINDEVSEIRFEGQNPFLI